jgi:membrane peptidoglycan carboxypeptidase
MARVIREWRKVLAKHTLHCGQCSPHLTVATRRAGPAANPKVSEMTLNGDPEVKIDPQPASGEPAARKQKKSKRAKVLTASFAALAILAGGVVVAGYYYDSISEILPDHIAVAQVTQIMAADGKTQLAQLGTVNRIEVAVEAIPERSRMALIAGEDPDFFKDSWGGSAISRAYIRIATGSDLSKPRLAVLARKLEDKYSRIQIMGFFLNAVDFGRGAIGVEKAAQAYFGKKAVDLTVAEAAVLGAVIRAPYNAQGGPSPYDPETHPDAAQAHWASVLDAMVDKGWMTPAERAGLQLPRVRPNSTVGSGAEWGIKVQEGDPQLAVGNVVNHVYEELKAQGIAPEDLKTGGYRITTSIDPQAQRMLERYARPDLPGSQLNGRTIVKGQDLEAAGVVIDHTTGRVLAYYGGIDGTGTDLADVNTGAGGPFGGHEPGASMEIYTLATALEAGASLKSHWKSLPFATDDRMKIGNGGAANTACKDYCTLEYSFAKSYNVPFYWVARQIGPGRVVRMANAAGVGHLWDDSGHEMLTGHVQDAADRSPFDRQVGFGQYAVTVLDHAAGVSTFANGGVANKPHFVVKVEKRDPASGQYAVVGGLGEKLTPQQVVRREVANDVTYAMKQAVADRGWSSALNGRDVAAAPGVWGATVLDETGRPMPSRDNAHAWVVGFTKQITVAVWTGNAAGAAPVTDPLTKTTITTAAPLRIWSGFVSDYSAAQGLPKEPLAGPSRFGDDDFPQANGVKP